MTTVLIVSPRRGPCAPFPRSRCPGDASCARPGGQLLFVEHGLSPEESVQKWQNRLTPVWKRIGGGCHLNRPIRVLIESAGFGIVRLETGYMKGPRPMTFLYEGCASP
jgi:hypothetical protein